MTATGDDEDVVDEDARVAWLRARGVEIETPEDRARARSEREKSLSNDAGVEREQATRTVTYVRIPCDDAEAFVEETLTIGETQAGDALPDALRRRFAGGGEVDADKARAEAVRSLGERGAGISKEAIVRETEGGSTETFALVRPSETNGWCGVYLYLDEVGMLKGLPPNRRAEGLSRECGFDGVNFYGDMFIGRVRTKPEPMRSVDFQLKDLDSSATWMRAATMENVEYSKGLKELEDAMNKNGGMEKINMSGDDAVASGGNGMPRGASDNYRWSQTEDEVDVDVDVPPGTIAKAVRVQFSSSRFIVKVNDEIICDVDDLHNACRPDESTWTMGADEVCVSLAKRDEGRVWRALTGR